MCSINKGLAPISRTIDVSCASVSCSAPAFSTEASMVGQCFRGVPVVSESKFDRSVVDVADPDESETDVDLDCSLFH